MTTPKNPRKPVQLGITGERVARRLKQIREDIRPRMSLRTLEAELMKLDHPISADGLSKIEIGKRRVDVDDLVPLAIALRVSPITLLLPATEGERDRVELTDQVRVDAQVAWDWARVRGQPYLHPLPSGGHVSWDVQRSLPNWAALVESVPVLVADLLRSLMEKVSHLTPEETELLKAVLRYNSAQSRFSASLSEDEN